MTEQLGALGIVGSPREGGNTDVLVEEILAGAQERGAQIERAALRDLSIEPCRACDACHETGQCVIDDDMAGLVDRMRDFTAWVMGTPVYWWGPTAQFKAFLDRWYMFDQRRDIFRKRRVVFAVPSGGGAAYAQHAVGILEEVANYLGMDHRGTLVVGVSGERGAVRSQTQVMEQARDLGRLLIG